MITYKEQFDKLTRAYINGEVNPYDCKACFVGNLLNNKKEWGYLEERGSFTSMEQLKAMKCLLEEGEGTYSAKEIVKIELNFMRYIWEANSYINNWGNGKMTPIMEDCLFKAFESTLEMLKAIHISKGEQIDESPVFVKRTIKTKEAVC